MIPVMSIRIRPEGPSDQSAIYQVNAAAFPSPAEAALVDRLRQEGAAYLSLVAELENMIVGHILFSPVEVRGETGVWPALALGPIAVLPAYQGQGIGSQLVQAGLATCHEQGQDVVFVLGHSSYYPRFGFTPTRPLGITSTYDVPDDVFMVAELRAGAVAGRVGTVHYHPAFEGV